MPKQPDYPLMIPYSELCELLDASRQIKDYQAQVKSYEAQVLALRLIQQECLDMIRELQKQI